MSKDLNRARRTLTLLQRLGLTRNESKCYLALLTCGSVSVNELAKEAGVNRVNTYAAVRGLREYGLIEQSLGSKKRLVHAAPLVQLQQLAAERQKQATHLRWHIEDLLPELVCLTQVPREETFVLTFDGPQTIIRLLERSLTIVPDGELMRELCLFSEEDSGSTQTFSEQTYIPQRVDKQCFKHLLCTDQKIHRGLLVKDVEELRETRFLTNILNLGLDACNVCIYADEVSLYWRLPTPTGLVIHHEKIASVFRLLFDALWEREKSTSNQRRIR